MFKSSTQTSFEISIKIKLSIFVMSLTLIYAINNYLSVIRLTETSMNVLTDMKSQEITWFTIKNQLSTLKRVMFALETSNRIKKTIKNELEIENKYFFSVARIEILKIDIFCKMMQIVFHAIENDEVDITTWRFIYVNDDLNDAIITNYIFMFKISDVYRDLYESSIIERNTTKSFELLTISFVLIMKNQIYDDVMHYIRLSELKFVNRFSYVTCILQAFFAFNRFAKMQNWTTNVVYKQH